MFLKTFHKENHVSNERALMNLHLIQTNHRAVIFGQRRRSSNKNSDKLS